MIPSLQKPIIPCRGSFNTEPKNGMGNTTYCKRPIQNMLPRYAMLSACEGSNWQKTCLQNKLLAVCIVKLTLFSTTVVPYSQHVKIKELLSHVTQWLVGLVKRLTWHTGSRGVNLEVNALKLTPMEWSVKLLVTFKTTSIDKATGWACCMRKICLAKIQEILSTHTLCGAWGYCPFEKGYLRHYLWWSTLEERSNSI